MFEDNSRLSDQFYALQYEWTCLCPVHANQRACKALQILFDIRHARTAVPQGNLQQLVAGREK